MEEKKMKYYCNCCGTEFESPEEKGIIKCPNCGCEYDEENEAYIERFEVDSIVENTGKLTERKIEQILTEMILDNSNGTEFETVQTIESYSECGVLTRDKGIVISMEDGTKIYLTIQGYSPNRYRME